MQRFVLALALIALVVSGCANPAQTGSTTGSTQPANTSYDKPDLLAETDWLASNLTRTDIRIIDMRSKEKYDAGHIPGAVLLGTGQLKDPQDKLYAPTPANFTKLMNDLGVNKDTEVIAYDDQGGLGPARLWWTLDYYGHTKARVLNGGWNKWSKESKTVNNDQVKVQPGNFTVNVNPDVVCALDYVEQNVNNPNVVIVDARSAGEFNGTDVRANRGGHIPKAVNIDWQRNVTNDDVKVWKSASELRSMYEGAGVTPQKQIITYCQTAVRAAHTLFTLRLLGYDQVKNYDGSWAEWGNSSSAPIVR